MLRDSGAQQSLLSKQKLSAHDYLDSGEYRLIQGIGGSVIKVHLKGGIIGTKIGAGSYLFGLADSLADAFFDGLIGNDLDPSDENLSIKVVNAVTRLQTAEKEKTASNQDKGKGKETKSNEIKANKTQSKQTSQPGKYKKNKQRKTNSSN